MDVALWRRGREERQRHPHPFNSPLPQGEGITARDSGCPSTSSRPAGCASHAIVVRMPAVRGNSDRGDVPAANLTAKASG